MNGVTTLLGMLTLGAAAQAAPVVYLADPTHTSIVWEARHLSTSTLRGVIQAKEGSMTLDRQAKSGKVNVSLDMNSFFTPVASLNGILRGDRAFNVASQSTASFEGDQFTFDGDKVSAVSGRITIAGKTQPATLTATHFNATRIRCSSARSVVEISRP